MDFEQSLQELEKIVSAMEKGEPTLQELVKSYSRGIELVNKCQNDLDRAAKTIDLLAHPDGTLQEADLSALRD